MEFCSRKSIVLELDFQPLKSRPYFEAPVALANVLLSGWQNTTTEQVVNYELRQVAEAQNLLQSLYPDMSVSELSRLHHLFSKNHKTLDAQFGFSAYLLLESWGHRLNENFAVTLNALLQTPRLFQDWIAKKKWGVQDLSILRSIPEWPLALNPLLLMLAAGSCSKQEGVLALERVVELLLLGSAEEALFETLSKPLSGSALLAQLEELRFPENSPENSIDKINSKNILGSWGLPANTQALATRRGDRQGVELKIFFSTPQELSRQVSRLEQIQLDLASGAKNLPISTPLPPISN